VLPSYAELLKQRFGSALASEVFENRMITIPGINGRDPKEISEKNLAYIIQARVEEIFDIIDWEIRRSGYEKKILSGIVLTGGGSLLKNIDKLVEYHTSYITKVGYPTELLSKGCDEEIVNPMFSTGIGLLLRGFEVESRCLQLNPPAGSGNPELINLSDEVNEREAIAHHKKNWLEKLFNGTTEFFGAGVDKELK
jgi:cell division protein FtsA